MPVNYFWVDVDWGCFLPTSKKNRVNNKFVSYNLEKKTKFVSYKYLCDKFIEINYKNFLYSINGTNKLGYTRWIPRWLDHPRHRDFLRQ